MKNILLTLKFKIALFIIILLLVTASIFTFLTVQTMNSHILDEVIKRAESVTKSTAAVAPYSVLSGDALGIDNIVSKVKAANPDVEFVIITNAAKKIIAHSEMGKRGARFDPTIGKIIKKAMTAPSYTTLRMGRSSLKLLRP